MTKRTWIKGAALVLIAALALVSCSKKGGSAAISKEAAGFLNGAPATATDFRYELNAAGDGVVITGYIGKGECNLVIPSEIEGFPVVEFKTGRYSEFQNKKFTAVVFPDSITKMSGEVLAPFSDSTLVFIKLPKQVNEIPQLTDSCPALTTIILPEKVEKIGVAAFHNLNITSIELPEGVKEIGNNAFGGCKQLASIKIPESIEAIGMLAFVNCVELITVTIPPKQIQYKDDVFGNCPRLSLETRKAIQDTGYTGRF